MRTRAWTRTHKHWRASLLTQYLQLACTCCALARTDNIAKCNLDVSHFFFDFTVLGLVLLPIATHGISSTCDIQRYSIFFRANCGGGGGGGESHDFSATPSVSGSEVSLLS